MNKQYVFAKLPFIACVDDYHEFENIIRSFKSAGVTLKYEEIGYGYTKFGGGYHAVFYKRKDIANRTIKIWKSKLECE